MIEYLIALGEQIHTYGFGVINAIAGESEGKFMDAATKYLRKTSKQRMRQFPAGEKLQLRHKRAKGAFNRAAGSEGIKEGINREAVTAENAASRGNDLTRGEYKNFKTKKGWGR